MNKNLILLAIALCSCNSATQKANEMSDIPHKADSINICHTDTEQLHATKFQDITFAQALEIAKAEDKRVFINCHTKTCGPCKMMERTVFPLKELDDYFKANYVCISLDAEEGEGIDICKKNNVEIYPTYLIFESDGTLLCSIIGAIKDSKLFLEKVKQTVAEAEASRK